MRGDVCKVCSYPLTFKKCIRPSVHSPYLTKTYCIGFYRIAAEHSNDFLSKHIRNLKEYKDKAEPLGLAISELIKNRDKELLTFDLLVPIPQHRDGMKIDKISGEEFNQAEELATWIGDTLSIPVAEVLEKTRDESLHEVDCAERERRTIGLYKCAAPQVKDKSVLIIDDVNTCGTTLNRCAEVLKVAGAKEVRAYVCGITHLN